jgi:hypothetical protein
MNLLLAAFMLASSYFLGWHQLYGQFVNPVYRKYQNWLLLLSIPMTMMSVRAVRLITEHFDQKTWPSRMFTFSIGITMFTLLSSFYFDEKIGLKTAVLICLSAMIVALQVFWK